MEMEVCIGLHLFNSEKQKAKCKREYEAEEDDCKTQGQYVLVMFLQNKLV